jgi:hypothetical protein
MSEAIRVNDEGEHVRVYQRNLNERLHARGEQPIEVDGRCGPETIERSAFAAWFLGAMGRTIKTVQSGTITPGLQRIVAVPHSRNDGQLQRARKRRCQSFPWRTFAKRPA